MSSCKRCIGRFCPNVSPGSLTVAYEADPDCITVGETVGHNHRWPLTSSRLRITTLTYLYHMFCPRTTSEIRGSCEIADITGFKWCFSLNSKRSMVIPSWSPANIPCHNSRRSHRDGRLECRKSEDGILYIWRYEGIQKSRSLTVEPRCCSVGLAIWK